MDIALVKYLEDDFDSFKRMVSDEETMRFISGIVWTEDVAKIQLNAILEINAIEENLGFFKIVNQQNEFIGNCSLEY